VYREYSSCIFCTNIFFLHGLYDQVCTGKTGHAESTQIEFDPKVISFEKILNIFWHTHNPTTLNRQGNDFGTQYRSVIFYHDEKQKEIVGIFSLQVMGAAAIVVALNSLS